MNLSFNCDISWMFVSKSEAVVVKVDELSVVTLPESGDRAVTNALAGEEGVRGVAADDVIGFRFASMSSVRFQ